MPDTNEPWDVLTDVARRLESTGLRYMLSGSAAGMFYGLNRTTADFDVAIELELRDIEVLADAFLGSFVPDIEMVEDAVRRRSMFNFIPAHGGMKVDFIVVGDDPLDREAMDRSVRKDWHGTELTVIDAADLVLNKLRWAKMSESELQRRDIKAIMSSGSVVVDERFERWVRRLGVGEILDAALST